MAIHACFCFYRSRRIRVTNLLLGFLAVGVGCFVIWNGLVDVVVAVAVDVAVAVAAAVDVAVFLVVFPQRTAGIVNSR